MCQSLTASASAIAAAAAVNPTIRPAMLARQTFDWPERMAPQATV